MPHTARQIPPADDAKLQVAARCLLAHQRLRIAEIIFQLGVGIPSLFVGPILISYLYWLAAFQFGHFISPQWMLFGSTTILIPLLFWTDYRTHGNYFCDTVAEVGLPSSSTSLRNASLMTSWGALAAFTNNPRLASSGIVELSLWGPRQVREALAKLRGAVTLRGVDRSWAADALVRLWASEHGPDIEALLMPGRPLEQLLAVLAYLLFYDWIGVSKDGKRVWITSESRAVLEKSFNVVR